MGAEGDAGAVVVACWSASILVVVMVVVQMALSGGEVGVVSRFAQGLLAARGVPGRLAALGAGDLAFEGGGGAALGFALGVFAVAGCGDDAVFECGGG